MSQGRPKLIVSVRKTSPPIPVLTFFIAFWVNNNGDNGNVLMKRINATEAKISDEEKAAISECLKTIERTSTNPLRPGKP